MRNQLTKKTILSVTLVNISVNLLLAILKIFFGFIGFSQALIADGIHSFSDVITDALVYIAAHASTHHPDSEHPYGHHRIETLGTIIIALILVSVAGSVAYEAILRLIHRAFQHMPTSSVIIVAVSAIIINELLFHYSKKQGEKINSTLIISNAWHKRSDVFISLIVLISVIGSLLGWHWLDAIGALAISIVIFKMAVFMIWNAIQELIDRGVDEKTQIEIKNIAHSISGVHSVHQLRTRLHGNYIFIDLHIIVDPYISVSEGHHIGEEVHAALSSIRNCYDVTVHIDPENDELVHPSLHLPNRKKLGKLLAKHWSSLPGYSQIKKINLHYLNGQLSIEVYMTQSTIDDISKNELVKKYQDAIATLNYIHSVAIFWG